MAALNYLKTQIRDIKSIYRVTKAMELLSIVRMRQVESKVLASQVFFKEIYHTFQEIVSHVVDSPYKVKQNQQQKPKTI